MQVVLNYVSQAPNQYIERHKLLKGANSLRSLIESADSGGRELIKERASLGSEGEGRLCFGVSFCFSN